MGEAAAAEGLMHRRIEFHAATKPRAAAAAVAVPGGFRMERLFADADKRVAVARFEGDGRRLENGESSGSGFDPDLSAARIYPRRIGAGLHNLGNTCYLNSVLQCLTYTEPFVAYLQSGKHESSCRTAGFCALCALQNHVRSALQSTGKILTPMPFVKNLRCISRSFRYYRQEDAHELMVSLLESMHKCCLPSGIPSESPSAYEKSLVHRIFGGRLRSQVRCTRCSHCSNKFDPFLDLSLEIGNATTLMKALHNFTEEELLDGGEKHYNCQQCKQKVVAKKRFIIDKAPSVLTIHLKRFSPFNPLQKIDKKVDFQTTLNLKPFVSNTEGMDLKYSLYGVLVHAGWNTQSGHYYCFVRTSSGIWHNLDDNQVRQVREADVLKQKAYMLFYVRDRVRSSVIHKGNGAASLSEKKMISENIACMNGVIRNGLVETTLDVSSITKEDMKLQKQNPDNGQPSDISGASRDQCSIWDVSSIAKEDMKLQKQNPDHGQPSAISGASRDQCLNEHSSTEVIKYSTSQNNEPIQESPCAYPDGAAILSSKTEKITPGSQRETMTPEQPDASILEMKLHRQNPDNGQPSNISAGLQDQWSNEHGSSEVIKASASQYSEPVQEAPRTHPDGAATLSTKTEQITPVGQTETTSPGQPDVSILCDASSDQKAYEKPLQELQLKPDGALSDPCKDLPAAAFQLCNGADGLLGANEQANETDPVYKPTSDSDATTIAQVMPTEDTAVSNGAISNNEDSTCGNDAKETECVKQHDELVVVKQLSAKNIDDEVNAEEQIAVPNNPQGDGQAMVKELSVMDTGHVADSEEQNNSLDTGHVNCEKKFFSEDSAPVVCSKECAQVMFSEDSVQVVGKDPCHGNLHKNMKIKSKKHVKYPAVNFYSGSKQLLLASLKPHKKRKHKRTRRRSASSVNTESIANDQQTSTSETVLTSGISSKSHRQKRSRNIASSEDGVWIFNNKQSLGDSSSASDLTMDKKDRKDATFASADSCPSSLANHDTEKCALTNEKGSWHFNLLTRGLREITVPRWDGNEMPNTTASELQYLRSTSIGYVLDEWDEEYDRGKRKKVRKSKGNFSGPNPFQETANIRSRQRRRLKADQTRSGHQPLRI